MAQADDKKEGIVGLYLDLRNSLARSVRGIVPPKDVEDIVQETYVRVCQIEQKRIITSPRSYLFRIARNLALDHIKRCPVDFNAIATGDGSDLIRLDTSESCIPAMECPPIETIWSPIRMPHSFNLSARPIRYVASRLLAIRSPNDPDASFSIDFVYCMSVQ